MKFMRDFTGTDIDRRARFDIIIFGSRERVTVSRRPTYKMRQC